MYFIQKEEQTVPRVKHLSRNENKIKQYSLFEYM